MYCMHRTDRTGTSRTCLTEKNTDLSGKYTTLSNNELYSPENAYQNFTENNIDLLGVDLTAAKSETNRPKLFQTSDASKFINSPINSGIFIGERIVHFGYANRLMVEIIEFYPNQGRHLYNHFNWTEWSGWECLEPQSIITKEHKITLNKVTSPTANNYTIDVSLSGYTPLIAVGADSGNMDNNIFYCKVSGNNVNLGIKQGYTGDVAIQAGVTVMYLHS